MTKEPSCFPIEPLIGGLIPWFFMQTPFGLIARLLTIEPLIGGLIPSHEEECNCPHFVSIEPLIGGLKCSFAFLKKGSGGGVVYGFGVWRVKSWVKNVLNANKYIAISPIKWGWSPLTYLPLVVIIFEKSIILFYWIPFRGLMLAIKNLFIFWPLLNPLYGIDTTLREWGIRNEEWAIIFGEVSTSVSG